MVEAVRGTGRNVVGVPGSPRFLVSRVLRGNKARVLFRAGTRAGPGAAVSRPGIEKFPVQHRRGSSLSKQRTSYFPLTGLDSATRLLHSPVRDSHVFSARLRDRKPRPDPDRCITHIMLESSVHIIDTIADSLWYFNDTILGIVISWIPRMNYSKGVTSSSEFHVKC